MVIFRQGAAYEVRESLGTIVPTLPTTESQCRPLAKLKPETQKAVWKTTVERAGGERITAKLVQSVADEFTEPQETEQPSVNDLGAPNKGEKSRKEAESAKIESPVVQRPT